MGRAPECHCICTGTGGGYSGGGGGGGGSGGSSSGGSGLNPVECADCIDGVFAAAYKITMSGVTGDCAASFNGTFNVGYHTALPTLFYSHHGNFPDTGGSGERVIMRNAAQTPKCCEFPYNNSPSVSRFILTLCGAAQFGVLQARIGSTGNTTLCSAGTMHEVLYANTDAAPIDCLSVLTYTRTTPATVAGHTWPATITVEPVP